MSWYSDGERFDEYDHPWCKNCDGGESKEECDKCYDRHMEMREAKPVIEADGE